MAYIGQGIKQGTFKVLDTSGNTYNGSNTTFSLGTQVGSAAQLLVSHDGVIQKAGTDYTLATGGTQITFSTAPASGASIFITEISGAVGGTVTPSDASVTSDKIADTAVTSAKLNSAILTGHTDIGANIADADLFLVDDGAGGTLRKTAASRIKTYVGGFDVSSITGATALAEQPAATDEIVLSDAGTLKRLDIKHIQNTPAFHAYKGSNQSVAHNTVTKITFDTEVFDSDGAYDASTNHRFTPGVAGKYFLYYQMKNNNQTDYIYSRIQKNGTDIHIEIHYTGADVDDMARGSRIVDSDADDYFEIHLQQTKGSNQTVEAGDQDTYFGGFRIAGV